MCSLSQIYFSPLSSPITFLTFLFSSTLHWMQSPPVCFSLPLTSQRRGRREKTNTGTRIFTKVTITRNGRGKADDSFPLHQLFFSLFFLLLHHESPMAEKTMRGREEAKQKKCEKEKNTCLKQWLSKLSTTHHHDEEDDDEEDGDDLLWKKTRMHLSNQGKEMTKKEWTWGNEEKRKGRRKWN